MNFLRAPTIAFLAAFLIEFLLRSEPVNSEEGAPTGIGIWYETWISDPVAYLFKNTDPRGSLRANVSNSTVRCLSNMPLADMLETRHTMSQAVRAEVSGKPRDWGYLARVPEVSEALFQILETQRMVNGSGRLTLLPGGPHGRVLSNWLAARPAQPPPLPAS